VEALLKPGGLVRPQGAVLLIAPRWPPARSLMASSDDPEMSEWWGAMKPTAEQAAWPCCKLNRGHFLLPSAGGGSVPGVAWRRWLCGTRLCGHRCRRLTVEVLRAALAS